MQMKKLMSMIIAGSMFITIFTIFLPVETIEEVNSNDVNRAYKKH